MSMFWIGSSTYWELENKTLLLAIEEKNKIYFE
jgi:hypothetical protein